MCLESEIKNVQMKLNWLFFNLKSAKPTLYN